MAGHCFGTLEFLVLYRALAPTLNLNELLGVRLLQPSQILGTFSRSAK